MRADALCPKSLQAVVVDEAHCFQGVEALLKVLVVSHHVPEMEQGHSLQSSGKFAYNMSPETSCLLFVS